MTKQISASVIPAVLRGSAHFFLNGATRRTSWLENWRKYFLFYAGRATGTRNMRSGREKCAAQWQVGGVGMGTTDARSRGIDLPPIGAELMRIKEPWVRKCVSSSLVGAQEVLGGETIMPHGDASADRHWTTENEYAKNPS